MQGGSARGLLAVTTPVSFTSVVNGSKCGFIERDAMCLNIEVKRTAAICRYIEDCFKTGSGGNNLDKEDIVRRIFERDDSAGESSERFECRISNEEKTNYISVRNSC